MPVSQLVALRNLTEGVLVISPDSGNVKNYLEFQPAGDPDGNDVQFISEELANTPAVVKNILHGALELDQGEEALSPDIQQSFAQQMAAARRQRERQAAAIAASIERTEDHDLVAIPCIGPGPRGGECGADVLVKNADKQDNPPLCRQHRQLTREYIPTENFDGKKHITTWTRARVGAREKAAE